MDEGVEAADRAVMARATKTGLVTLGRLPRLGPGTRVAFLATSEVRASAASQVSARPADELVAELLRRGVNVSRLELAPGETSDPTPWLGGMSPLPQVVLYASTSRTRLASAEAATARRAAAWARHAGVPYAHVALWNPYSAELLPGPALLAFGYRGSAPVAVADALMGEATVGTLPAPISSLA